MTDYDKLRNLESRSQQHYNRSKALSSSINEKTTCPVCDDVCECNPTDLNTIRRWKAYYEGYDWGSRGGE